MTADSELRGWSDPTAIERGDSLRDKALRILRQGIVSGEIRAGELYSASAMARRLGVSVSPVREAMLTLVNAGILEAVRNRGFRVAELSPLDLDEIFEMRVMLEVPAMQALAAEDLTDRAQRLDELVRATESTAAARDVNAFLAADREFHLEVLSWHGNGRLSAIVADLRDQTKLYGLQETSADVLLRAAVEHREIMDALLSRDVKTTGRLMSQHLSHVRNEWAGPNISTSGPGNA